MKGSAVLDVREVATALESGDTETLPLGGFKRNQPPTRPSHGKPDREKPHPQHQPTLRTLEMVVTEESPVIAVLATGSPEGVKPMIRTGPRRVEPLYCPTCPDNQPKTRTRATDLVCGDCYRIFTNEASVTLAKDGKLISLFAWVAAQASARLTSLEAKYALAKTEVDELEKTVLNEALAALKRATGGANIDTPIWKNALKIKKSDLWKVKGGDAKYARMKELSARIAHLNEVIARITAEKAAAQTAETAQAVVAAPETTTALLVVPVSELITS